MCLLHGLIQCDIAEFGCAIAGEVLHSTLTKHIPLDFATATTKCGNTDIRYPVVEDMPDDIAQTCPNNIELTAIITPVLFGGSKEDVFVR